MTQKLTVVVTGSTGKQGAAVARGLLDRDHKVRAVTRDPNSSPAKVLANAGATIVAASLGDTAAAAPSQGQPKKTFLGVGAPTNEKHAPGPNAIRKVLISHH